MKKQILLIFLFISITSIAKAQNVGNSIFDNTVLHEIRLEFIEPDYWSILINNYVDAGENGKVPYLMGDVTIDGEKVDSVGIRLKGYTSFGSSEIKKPIKIDFNRFVKGKKYDGLKKINLNNGTGDPSMQRDVICYDLLRSIGVKASRTSYSKVYINDKYWGLYQNIEQIDKTFLKDNFAHGRGNLFKNKGWDTLQWKGDNPDLYHPPYELKTNEEENDWSGFVNFVDVLNNTSDEVFEDSIKKVFDVDLFLKTLTVDVATNNWDSYLEHGRNWYIYEDTVTGIFSWIPWDYNFSLNSNSFDFDTTVCQIYADFSYKSKDSVVVEFKDQSFYNKQPRWEWDFGDGTSSSDMNPTHVFSGPGKYKVCMKIIVNDTCHSEYCKEIDTKFKVEDCPSIVNGTCPHPVDDVFEAVLNWNPECCNNWTDQCEETYKWIYDFNNLGSGRDFDNNFSLKQQDNDRVLINRLLNVPDFNNRYYSEFCNLLNNYFNEDYLFPIIDKNRLLIEYAVKADTNFLYSYEKFIEDNGTNSDTTGIKQVIKNRFDSLKIELNSLFTCPESNLILEAKDIVINEFVASNDSTSNISDSEGKYEDWIEIYNNTNRDLDISNVYFSDDFAKAKKWKFSPETFIGKNQYLIVWADKDVEQEGIHSNFKLKKSGEQLILSNSDGSIIDSLTFGEQTTNISMARRPNGTGDFIAQEPTFGYNNDLVSTKETFSINGFSIRPNPAKDNLIIGVKNYANEYQYRIYSTTGELVKTEVVNSSYFTIDLSYMESGLYLFSLINKNGQIQSKKFIVKK